MNKKKILLWPTNDSKKNYYISNLYCIIAEEYEVDGYEQVKKKNIFKILSYDVYHFNWYENIKDKQLKGLIKYFVRSLFVFILKIANKKIVWTVHNKEPHDEKSSYSRKLMEKMAKKADRIHILCKDTKNVEIIKKYNEKIVYIPHGDYFDNFKKVENINLYEKYGIDKNKQIILYTGLVRKYKNIPILLNAFKKANMKDFVLLITGECDESYKKELSDKNNNLENIYYNFNYLTDEEMEEYLSQSAMLIAMYDKKSSLNSGNLCMAMSYGKTMMLPLIGSVKDIENYNEFLYTYDYNSEKEHVEVAISTLEMIQRDYEANNNILKEKGNLALKYMQEHQSWKVNKEKWINLYNFK